MSTETLVILGLLAIAGAFWWRFRKKPVIQRTLADEDDPSAPHDHARAHELARAQADLQRWSGPH